jgi:hypothetical protein
MVDQKLMEAISNGDLTLANERGTSYGLQQWIDYSSRALYSARFRKTIPSSLLAT